MRWRTRQERNSGRAGHLCRGGRSHGPEGAASLHMSRGPRVVDIDRLYILAQVRPMPEKLRLLAVWVRRLERGQYGFLRVVLGCGRKSKPAAAALRAELGLPSLQARRHQLRLGYWAKLCSAEPNRLLSTVFRNRWREACQWGAGTSCLQDTRRVMDELGFADTWREGLCVRNWYTE
jgi:hypothetical protein